MLVRNAMESAPVKWLLFILGGGLLFFGLLAGVHLWKNSHEEKNMTELLALAEEARENFDHQKWEGCLARYENLYEKSSHPFFRVLSLHGRGSCFVGKKDYHAAAEAFERAAKEPGHVDPLLSRLESARCYRLAGDPSALAKMEALSSEAGLSPRLKTEVEEEVAWLRSEKKD